MILMKSLETFLITRLNYLFDESREIVQMSFIHPHAYIPPSHPHFDWSLCCTSIEVVPVENWGIFPIVPLVFSSEQKYAMFIFIEMFRLINTMSPHCYR
jgi:hypothetical protein